MIPVRLRPLFEGHAAGHYTLPAEVLAEAEVVRNLEQLQEQHQATGPAAREALAEAIVAAAKAGKPLPTAAATAYVKAEETDRAMQARATVLAEVLERREMTLETLVSSSAVRIVVECLKPALAETLREAKLPAEAIEPFGTDLARLVNAPDDARAAFGVLQDLAARYSAIRTARNVFRPELKPEHDGAGVFGELRNLPDVHPSYRSVQAPTPSPKDAIGRLVWLVTSAAEPWMPTPEEQDERWMEVFGEAFRNKAAQAAAARMFGARTAEPV